MPLQSLDGLRAGPLPGWQRSSLRNYLVAVILLSTVPVAVLLSHQVYDSLKSQHQRLMAELGRGADALARLVEREVAASAMVLRTVAPVGTESADDAAALRADLQRLQRLRPAWRGVFVLEADGALRFDTLGAPGFAPNRVAAAELQSDASVFVSPLVAMPGNAGAMTAVAVRLAGRGGAIAGAWVDAAHWRHVLQLAARPDDGFATLFDQADRVIARASTAALADSPAPPALEPLPAGGAQPQAAVRALRDATTDDAQHVVLDGREVMAAWRRVGTGRWGVAVALDAAAIDAGYRRSFGIALFTTAACMLLGLTLGLLLARRLIQPLDEMSSGGPALAVTPSPILEIERLRERLLTAQAHSDAAIARLEAKAAEFQALFDSSPVGLSFAQDRNCRVVLHNPRMKALFGPVAGARSAPARVLYEGQPLLPHQQPLYRAATSGNPVGAMELHVDSGDGRPTVVLVHAVPLHDAAGRPRGAIEAAVDITGRKEDERRLMEADDRLRENQHLIELAQEAGHVGFFSYDFGLQSLTWSPGQARLFGLEAGDGEMTLASWLPRVDPAHRVDLEHLLRQMLLLGQEKETFDYRLTLAGGDTRWMSSRVLVQYHDDGAPKQMIGVTVDVSRHKALEEERAQLVEKEQSARQQAEAANRAKDEILAMLGHELRNPLGAISSAVEVLQRIDRDGPMADSALEIMARQTANLARIMDDLLDVAGVISGRVALSRRPLDLGALAGRVVTTLQLTGSASGHELVTELTPVWVDADATRIEQMIVNLLSNAFKYTPDTSRIELSVTQEGDDAVLRVRDHGAGIAPELLSRIFDLFIQGEQPLDRRSGGLGVGLTLVRRLVTLHGGTVTADSSPAGSVFEVRLPTIGAPTPTQRVLLPRPDRVAPRSVVLVEDNEDASVALRTSLELDGHTVGSAADGLTGLQAIVADRPDVAIVDLGLPGLTGFEVALRSRAAGYPGLMIATSGYGQQADTQRALRSGFDVHLIKPVDAGRLRELLAEHA